MAVTFGYYNSLAGDRLYNAVQMSQLFSSIIADGVLGAIGDAFHVGVGGGMNVNVGIGRAWFHNSWLDNDSLLTLAIGAAHPTLPRIDRVIIEIDSSEGVRANDIKILPGTPAASPVGPTLTHTSTLNQYTFANIHVGAGVAQILASNIVNKIGTSECPLVTGILQTMTIDSIVAQWEAQFDFWFQTLQDELDENQAANLQNQITDANNTLIEEIIATGTSNEFVFDDIPGGFDMLRITGILKHTAPTGYDGVAPTIRINDDSGANYAYFNPTTGQWSGWGSNTSLNSPPVVTSVSKNVGFYTPFSIDFPSYDIAQFKWAICKSDFGAAPTINPSIDMTYFVKKNIWRSGSPIIKITISGTYVENISKLRLYG